MYFHIAYLLFFMGPIQGLVTLFNRDVIETPHTIIENHSGTMEEAKLEEIDKIKTLEIILSNITGLSKEIMGKFKSLERLTIKDTQIEKTEADAFANCCPNLKDLVIDNWKGFGREDLKAIGTLPLFRLEILNQNLRTLKSGDFQGENLRLLLLVQDNIEYIPRGAFEGIPNLEFIRISNNNIEKIPTAALRPLKKLHVLDLVSNGLTGKISDEEDLSDLPSLEQLVLEKENLTEIDMSHINKASPNFFDLALIDCNIGITRVGLSKITISNFRFVEHNNAWF